MRILIAAVVVGVAGCMTDLDFGAFSSFEPMPDAKFRYQVKYALNYPENSPEAEQYRIRWLQRYLDSNGMCKGGYVVSERRVARMGEHAGEIFYYGRCT